MKKRPTPLRRLIPTHVAHETIKELAHKAASLGNEFVHYHIYQKAEVRDLRNLIDLTWRWIELQEQTDSVNAMRRASDPALPKTANGSAKSSHD